MKFIIQILTGILLLSVLSLDATAEARSSFPVLESLVQSNNFAKAYQRALNLRDANEGDPRFDYLYGTSALNTAHYSEAVFVLERVVATNPKLTKARLDLAIAYVKNKNTDAALEQFRIALSQKPPKVVQQNIQQKIANIRAIKKTFTSKTLLKSALNFSVGYDDNINFGFNSEQIDLPIFGPIILNPSSVKQGSGYAETKLQIQVRKRRTKQLTTFADVNLGHRKYFKNSNFDVDDINFRVGLTINKNKKQYQVVLRDKPILLGGKVYSNAIGLDFVMRQPLSTNKILSTAISFEHSSNRKIPDNNKNRVTLYSKLDINKGKFFHQASVFIAKEMPKTNLGKKYSQDVIGASYKTSYDWNAKSKSFAVIDFRYSRHQAIDPLYIRRRKDNKIQLRVGHEWLINKRMAVTLSAQHVKNTSNLELYDAKRNEINLGVRYEW